RHQHQAGRASLRRRPRHARASPPNPESNPPTFPQSGPPGGVGGQGVLTLGGQTLSVRIIRNTARVEQLPEAEVEATLPDLTLAGSDYQARAELAATSGPNLVPAFRGLVKLATPSNTDVRILLSNSTELTDT